EHEAAGEVRVRRIGCEHAQLAGDAMRPGARGEADAVRGECPRLRAIDLDLGACRPADEGVEFEHAVSEAETLDLARDDAAGLDLLRRAGQLAPEGAQLGDGRVQARAGDADVRRIGRENALRPTAPALTAPALTAFGVSLDASPHVGPLIAGFSLENW